MFSPSFKGKRDSSTPRLTVNSEALLTSGGEVLCNVEGLSSENLTVLFNGLKVPAEFVKTNQGLRLKVTLGPGIGSGA